MTSSPLQGQCLVPGFAEGPVLFSDVGLSFMGGVDAATGRIIDVHHPLSGESVAGKILVLPSGRGSCSGSLVIFELLMNGHAPKALVFQHKESILTFGAIIAEEFFRCGIPVVRLDAEAFQSLRSAPAARVEGATVTPLSEPAAAPSRVDLPPLALGGFRLSEEDSAVLDGKHGEARRVALRSVIRMARLEGASRLISVDMAHIDGCFYQGPGGLQFIERLRDMGAQVVIPTTMNAISVDRRQWRDLGVDPSLGVPSGQLVDAYEAMGVQPTYTCAPYLLEAAPRFGQQIAWAESNAVMFANSVLGARTIKYPDYLDFLVALTGRAPEADCHLPEARQPALRITLPRPPVLDDAYFALIGYHCGKIAANVIPLIDGLAGLPVTRDHLKGFGAAFATTSAAPMFHISGITPEAPAHGPAEAIVVSHADLAETWRELNTAPSSAVDLVALGNPHLSLAEIADLAALCKGRTKAPNTALTITCGRHIFKTAQDAGHVAAIEAFGGRFLNDTCWCFIGEPVVAPHTRSIATNSGKFAHYGAAALRRGFHFASLSRCVDAAATGTIDTSLPAWLLSA